jgi:hypothetical protein
MIELTTLPNETEKAMCMSLPLGISYYDVFQSCFSSISSLQKGCRSTLQRILINCADILSAIAALQGAALPT